MKKITVSDLFKLEYSWTAVVRLKNDCIITIWGTSIFSTFNIIKEIISVSSDYPKHRIEN